MCGEPPLGRDVALPEPVEQLGHLLVRTGGREATADDRVARVVGESGDEREPVTRRTDGGQRRSRHVAEQLDVCRPRGLGRLRPGVETAPAVAHAISALESKRGHDLGVS